MSNGGWLKAIIAGALLWIAMILVAMAHQPVHAGSAIAIIDSIVAIVLAILACLILRW
jgi:uncharacterized membrane protein YjjP (DUF1212 family)